MTRITRLLLAAFLALASVSPAKAQVAPLYPAGAASIAASSVSSRVALPSSSLGATSVWLANTGAVDAFFKFGDVTVVATTGSAAIGAGACLAVATGGAGFLAAITATGSATLRLIQGPGVPGGSCSSSPITPGVITITQLPPVTLAAATSATLVAANANRKYLKWCNAGAAPMTVAPGAVTVVAGQGVNYDPGASSINQGGCETMESSSISQQAFSAISTAGTTATVWEGQ